MIIIDTAAYKASWTLTSGDDETEFGTFRVLNKSTDTETIRPDMSRRTREVWLRLAERIVQEGSR